MKDQCITFLKSIPLAPNDTIVCALSGGADSVALTLCLYHLYCEVHSGTRLDLPPFYLAIAHYNHGLRGTHSEQDAMFVEKVVENFFPTNQISLSILDDNIVSSRQNIDIKQEVITLPNIPLCIECGKVSEISAQTKQGIESTARRLRYDFLQRFATEIGATYIATAHTANDNAETMLFHLARGSGTKGLRGIPPKRGNIIRPILGATRDQIECYLTQYNCPHCHDHTNDSDQYTRNYIRHNVIPPLSQINPAFFSHCSKTSSILLQEDCYLDGLVQEKLPLVELPHAIELAVSDLLALPSALIPRGLALVAGRLSTALSFDFRTRALIVSLAQSENPSQQLALPLDFVVNRCYNRLIFTRKSPSRPPLTLQKLSLGETIVGDYQLTLCVVDQITQCTLEQSVYLPNHLELWVRGRQTGDKFQPKGRRTKSLKDWFIDLKIPRQIRDQIPIICTDNGEIVLVPPLGLSAHISPPVPETPALKLTYQPISSIF